MATMTLTAKSYADLKVIETFARQYGSVSVAVEKAVKPNFKCRVGFLDIPPLPDSFFDPLPEEELRAWGL